MHFILAIPPHQTYSSIHSNALEFAEKTKSRVTLVSVVESAQRPAIEDDRYKPSQLMEYATNKVNSQLLLVVYALQKSYPEIEFDYKVLIGTPYLEIINFSIKHKANYIIALHKHLPGSKYIYFGSTVKHLIRKSPIPVWADSAQPASKFNSIVVAIDVSFSGDTHSINDLTTKLVQHANQFSELFESQAYALHAWSLFGKNYLRNQDQKDLEYISSLTSREYKARLDRITSIIKHYSSPRLELVLIEGQPKKVIIDFVHEHNPDLLILGSVGRIGIPGLLIGNTAESVIDSVNCNVLTLKPDGFISPVQNN